MAGEHKAHRNIYIFFFFEKGCLDWLKYFSLFSKIVVSADGFGKLLE